MSNRYPQSLMTFSLVKSKEMLQKISNHLDNMQSNSKPQIIQDKIALSSNLSKALRKKSKVVSM